MRAWSRPLRGKRPWPRSHDRLRGAEEGVLVKLEPKAIVVLLKSQHDNDKPEVRSVGLIVASDDEAIHVEASVPDLDALLKDLQEARAWIAGGELPPGMGD